ncbi:MAG TPA: methyltransferase domain-containing protein [Thermoanaerobaculia bacterium]|nr:methyltransferase domain-containing protein [Thermoanaerobaculia bacterium]
MPLALFRRARQPQTEKKNRLHIGCGPVLLPGWINVDIGSYPGIDRRLDVRDGLPYADLRFIFAEHFIEHLSYDDGARLLADCRRALAPDGVLRLSTPNLDWVWMTQYHLGNWGGRDEAVRDCFWMNKAFRGWGHQFLYNLQTLTETLHQAGFAEIVSCRYGESTHEELRGIERHEQYTDTPELPHIIIVEASGSRSMPSQLLTGPLADYRQAIESE